MERLADRKETSQRKSRARSTLSEPVASRGFVELPQILRGVAWFVSQLGLRVPLR